MCISTIVPTVKAIIRISVVAIAETLITVITAAVDYPVWLWPIAIIVKCNLWPVNIDGIVTDSGTARPPAVVDIVNIYRRVGITAHIIRPRAKNIPAAVAIITIVDDGTTADDAVISAGR